MKARVLTFLLLILTTPLRAQEYRHLEQVHTPRTYPDLETWRGRAEALRAHLLVSTGLWPMPEKTPLHPRITEPLAREGYTIQNVVLETQPGFYLTGNLYRPLAEGPHPAILSAHGHWEHGRFEDSDQASVPGRAISFARQGYVVFSYSMIGYDETADAFPHRFDAPHYQLWGFSAMGLQLWNSLRALDFLSTLPDVDPERIGMTGASGGATQTFMLTAVDPRIKAAAPVNMISAHFQGGCICENGPLLRLDATNIEIGALAAPRPLLLVSTSGDWTRHTPAVEYPALRSIYRLFDAEDRIANVHLDYPHNYNRESREAVYRWFARWLLGRGDQPLQEEPFQVESPALLRADLPQPPLPLDTLFAHFVQQATLQLGASRPANGSDLVAFRETFGRALEHALAAGAGTDDLDLEVRPPAAGLQARQALLIVHPGSGTALEQARAMAGDYQRRGHLVFLLRPEAGPPPPDSIQYWTTYNPTPAARRIGEIRAAAERILARPDVDSLDLAGLGEAGPWTFLARALLPSVRRTTVDFDHFRADADEAYLDRLFVPLLRRAGDFKTAAAMVAPAPLTLQNLPPGPLQQWIEAVYQAAGAPDRLTFSR